MRKVLALLALWAFIPVACVHFNTVSTDIAPTATTPQKFPTKLGIYFTSRLINCEVIRKPDTIHGAEHEYHYRWGPALQEALLKSVRSAYTDIAVLQLPPRQGQFDRVISFDLPKVDLVVEFVPGYLRQEARAKASITINMEILDGKSMRPLKNLPVTGRGSSAKDASGFAAYASGQFTKAMEIAIQQLSEIVSQIFITGTAEPR